MSPDLSDTTDFENADRGFVDTLDPCVITDDTGRTIWDMQAYGFLDDDCPETANPSLWRQGRLCRKNGLYEVTPGVYQIRGFDLSNMSLIEGDTGVIVIDPLVSVEVAAAGLALYREHRGDRPVTGVIYTHSHVDHFGGVEGVIDRDTNVPIIAPHGFLEHAVSENVYAGNAMSRRGIYHTGVLLPPGPRGQIGDGLGITNSTGRVSLIPPTVDITRTGQTEVVDGVTIEFQLTPGTEAPAEMNFVFPDLRAACLAENATHNLHNLLTLRGAQVRDAKAWSRYLDEARRLIAGHVDVVFASHHWPTWGAEAIDGFLAGQRDLYGYLHDQTLRLLNQGLTGAEIAEEIDGNMPPALDDSWHTHGYYGAVSHNVKAIYQRYLGWFDGNPARLWQHPPRESATRYVDCFGGVDAVVSKAQEYREAGDLRFAAELLDKAVFAEPTHEGAKAALAEVLEQLGFGAECGTWRNFYLTGAQELRDGIAPQAVDIGAGMALALTVEQILDSLAMRIDGPAAHRLSATIDWDVTDVGEYHRSVLSNGFLAHHLAESGAASGKATDAELVFRVTKPQLLGLLGGGVDAESLDHTGDLAAFTRLGGVLVTYDRDFPIVTP